MTEETAIIADQEKLLYAGLTGSDADILGRVFSDKLTYLHSSAVAETRFENLTGQRSGLYKHGPITALEKHTHVFGDLAVTSGVIDMVDTAHGPATTLHLRETLVWIKEASTWRLLVRHATRLPA